MKGHTSSDSMKKKNGGVKALDHALVSEIEGTY